MTERFRFVPDVMTLPDRTMRQIVNGSGDYYGNVISNSTGTVTIKSSGKRDTNGKTLMLLDSTDGPVITLEWASQYTQSNGDVVIPVGKTDSPYIWWYDTSQPGTATGTLTMSLSCE